MELLLEEDALSKHTTPSHLFLDASTSSALDLTKPSSAHMFLSYVNTDSPSRGPLETGSFSNVMTPSDGQRDNNATAHVFLSYAANSSNRNGLNRKSFSWGDSMEEFELQCKNYIQIENNLTSVNAASVAKALRLASLEAGKGTLNNDTYRNSLHATFLDKALKNEHESFPTVDDDETPDLLAEDEGETSKSWEMNFLKDQVQRQQEEITFLRCALRQLVSSMSPVQKEEKKPSQAEEKISEPLIDLDDLPVVSGRLPSIIEIPSNDDSRDDVSESMSELQSPSVIVLKNRTNKSRKKEKSKASNSVTSLTLVNRNVSQEPTFPIAIPNPINEMAKHMVSSGAENYMKCMQVIYETRVTHRITYTDMAKGEVQENRARGMKFQLFFEKRGVTAQGLYSGTLKDGKPHGTGVLRFDNRDVYMGQFSEGSLDGQGTLLSRCNKRLVTLRGSFRNNEFVEQSSSTQPLSSEKSATSAGAA